MDETQDPSVVIMSPGWLADEKQGQFADSCDYPNVCSIACPRRDRINTAQRRWTLQEILRISGKMNDL